MDTQTPSSFVIRRFRKAEAPDDFERARALRIEVFIGEQGVLPDEEWDGCDDDATHWVVLDAATDETVATGRLIAYQEGCQARPVGKIGRIAVKKSRRGEQLGVRVMEAVIAHAAAEGYDQAVLDGQLQAIPFYERLGFVAEGEVFWDARIQHRFMRKALR